MNNYNEEYVRNINIIINTIGNIINQIKNEDNKSELSPKELMDIMENKLKYVLYDTHDDGGMDFRDTSFDSASRGFKATKLLCFTNWDEVRKYVNWCKKEGII